MDVTSKTVRELLASKTRYDLAKVGDDDPLFSSGVIDSFVMIDIMGFLERETGARLAPEDLEGLDSVQAIVAFAARQRSKG